MANNQSPQLLSGGVILPSTFVMLDVTNLAGAAQGNVGVQATANASTIGISMEGTDSAPGVDGATGDAAVSGESFKMYGLGDVCLLQCSGGWTSGDELVATTNGLGLTAPTSGVAQNIGAIALTNCLTTEFGLVQIMRYQKLPATTSETFSAITITDGGSIAGGTSSGTTIATNASQKLGFFGATPIIKPSSVGELIGVGLADGNFTAANATNMNSNGNNGSTRYGLNDIVKHLKELGLLTA